MPPRTEVHCDPGHFDKSWPVVVLPVSSWGIGSETASAECLWFTKTDHTKGKPAILTISGDTLKIAMRDDIYGDAEKFCVDDLQTLEEQEVKMDSVQLKFALKGEFHQWLRFEKTNHHGTGFHDRQLHKVFRLPEQKVKPLPEEWKKELKVYA